MTDYRSIWQEDYAQTQQERLRPPGTRERLRFGRVYAHYLRGWLPEDLGLPVLDIGCGAGLLLDFLKQRGHTQLQGLDSSPSQARLAQQLGFNVIQQDATAYLQKREKGFGLITALDFMEHLTRNKLLEFLDAALGALQPGGQVIFQTPNGESPWVGNVLYGDLTHEQCYTPHLLEKIMRRAGFQDIQFRSCGPAPVDPLSRLRTWIWAGITLGCRILNRVEGAVSSGVFTRVFLIRGTRPR